jgi:hypothetical protein
MKVFHFVLFFLNCTLAFTLSIEPCHSCGQSVYENLLGISFISSASVTRNLSLAIIYYAHYCNWRYFLVTCLGYKEVAYLDTDVGQPKFATPGCVATRSWQTEIMHKFGKYDHIMEKDYWEVKGTRKFQVKRQVVMV